MIELTREQRQALARQAEAPPHVVDPETDTTYVLIREEVYARLKTLLDKAEDDRFLHDMYPLVMEVLGKEGWDDPAMDVYKELDPRRSS